MAIAFRSATTRPNDGAGGLATMTIAKPSGTASGDLLVAVILWSSINPITGPSGWASLSAVTSNGHSLQVWSKAAGGSEPTSYSWSMAGAVVSAALAAYSGASGIAASATGATSLVSSVVAPPVTTTAADQMLLVVSGGRGASNRTLTKPADMTLRASVAANLWPVIVADVLQPTQGASGSRTTTASSSMESLLTYQLALSRTNLAPNAPTLVAPLSGTINRDAVARFSWTFSDPDTGDSQSAYDLRYRIGAAAWTTVSGSTPNAYRDLPAGTFVAGDYEWQVRTYDSAGIVGPYSASGFFTAGTLPPGPVITDPVSGSTIPNATYTVTWSTPEQDAYQLRTTNADGSVVYTDTGVVESSSARSAVVAFPVQPRAEVVQIRTRVAGLFSPYGSNNVTVSYTPPAVSTLTLTEDDAAGLIAVAYAQPTPAGDQPAVSSVEVHRRVTTVGGDGIRIAKNLPATGTYLDRTPASGVPYEHAVTAVGANGTTSTTAWSA